MDGALCSGGVERSLIYIFLALNIDRFSNFLPVEMLKCIGSPNKVVSRCRVLVYSFWDWYWFGIWELFSRLMLGCVQNLREIVILERDESKFQKF